MRKSGIKGAYFGGVIRRGDMLFNQQHGVVYQYTGRVAVAVAHYFAAGRVYAVFSNASQRQSFAVGPAGVRIYPLQIHRLVA